MTITLPLLSGLHVTAPQSTAECGDHRKLALAILHLLQLDRNPVQEAWEVFQASSDGPGPNCLVAHALKVQVLASVGLPVDLQPLMDAVAAEPSVYLAWERRHFAAVISFAQFDYLRAAELCADALAAEPRDAFSCRLLFSATFLCGRADLLLSGLADVLPRVAAHTDFAAMPYYTGLAAYALNECGHPRQALRRALDAIQDAEHRAAAVGEHLAHPFAVHAVCHVMQNEPAEGLRYLNSVIAPRMWKDTAFLTVHIYWHMSIMQHDVGDTVAALDTFDRCIVPRVNHHDMYSVGDSAAFLCRLRISEALPHCDPRVSPLLGTWLRSAEVIAPKIIARFPYFSMMLVATACVLCDDDGPLTDEHKSIKALAAQVTAAASGDVRAILQALASGRVECGPLLQQAAAHWYLMGGSNAQRDILQRICVWSTFARDPAQAQLMLRREAWIFDQNPYYQRMLANA